MRVLLYVGTALVAGLLVLELGLCLHGRPVAQLDWQRGLVAADPERGWRGRSDGDRWVENGAYDVFVALDEDGYRRPGSPPRSAASHAILVVGGSTAWGKGVGQGAVLSDWLRRDLPADVSVRNVAVPGYALAQIRQTAARVLSAGRFDEVVLLLAPGDLHDGDAWRTGGVDPDGLRAWAEARSRALRFLGRPWDRLANGSPAADAGAAPDTEVAADLASLSELTRRHGARLVVVFAPAPEEGGGDGGALRSTLEAAARASGAGFYDATAALRAPQHLPKAPELRKGLELFDARLGTWTQRAHFLAALGLIESGVLEATQPAFPSEGAVHAGPHHPFVAYEGRVERTSGEEARFDWPGVSVRVRIEADACRFLLRGDGSRAYFNVFVDGERQFVFHAGPEGRALEVRGLGPGAHEIRVQKRYQSSPVSFFGIELPAEGRILEPTPPPERRIEVLGASVAAGLGAQGFHYGYRNLGSRGRRCADKWRLGDAGSGYGAVLGERFGAEVRFTTREGVGVMRNYADPAPRSDKPFGVFFDRTLSSRVGDWQGSWQPDLVLLHLGENDYGNALALDEPAFRAEYVGLLERLRARYPAAWLIAFADEKEPRLQAQIRQAMAQRREAGDRRLDLVAYPHTRREDKGCNSHPTAARHRALAGLLAPRVEEALGWSPVASAPRAAREPRR